MWGGRGEVECPKEKIRGSEGFTTDEISITNREKKRCA